MASSWDQKYDMRERCHNEIGAPDCRINGPFGLVLTPWDKDLLPSFWTRGHRAKLFIALKGETVKHFRPEVEVIVVISGGPSYYVEI